MSRLDALLEAERRGILPAEMRGALEEARRRKLVSLDQSTPQQPAKPETSTAVDAAKSFGSGMVTGFSHLAGLPGTLRTLVQAGGDWAQRQMGLEPAPQLEDVSRLGRVLPDIRQPTGTEVENSVRSVVGERYKPQTTVGKYAQTAGEFAPGVLMGPGSLVQRGIGNVAAPAVGSEFLGQQFEGTKYEPAARVVGSIVGSVAPAVAARAISPVQPANQEYARQAGVLQREGIDLTAGDKTGSSRMRWMEEAYKDVPFSGGRINAVKERQAEQFTQAVLKRAGINAPRATDEVIDTAFREVGKKFDDLAASTYVPLRPRLLDAAKKVADDYEKTVSAANRVPLVRSISDELQALQKAGGANGAFLTGDQYRVWRSQIATAARGQRDASTAAALRDLNEALDNTVRVALQGPARQAWQDARRQYRNLLVIEKARSGSGQNAALGLLSPSAVKNAVAQQGKRAYVRGQGDYAKLANAGEAILKALPNSGTAQRQLYMSLPGAIGAGVGGIYGEDATGAGLGFVGGLAAQALLGRTMMSAPMQRYLGNQAAAPFIARYNTGQSIAAAMPATLAQREREPRR